MSMCVACLQNNHDSCKRVMVSEDRQISQQITIFEFTLCACYRQNHRVKELTYKDMENDYHFYPY